MVRVEPIANSAWAEARWLVIAPHPDDETLGAGALIATQAAAGRLAAVVFLTDGAASHTHPHAASRERLIALRRDEARQALSVLCDRAPPEILFLDWPDAETDAVDERVMRRDAGRLVDLCDARGVTAMAVTALHEPHCDHAAAARLARAVAVAAVRPPVLFEYLVWATTPPPGARLAIRTEAVPPARRTRALDQHRSQLTDLMGPGFRLDTARRDMPATDDLYLVESMDAS